MHNKEGTYVKGTGSGNLCDVIYRQSHSQIYSQSFWWWVKKIAYLRWGKSFVVFVCINRQSRKTWTNFEKVGNFVRQLTAVQLRMKHGKSKVISQNTLKTVKKSSVIQLGLGLSKFIFLRLLGETICQTFFVFNLFCPLF